MLTVLRWLLATFAVILALGPPVALYRYEYVQAKRFHEVTPGRFYRSGQMTATGFRDIIDRFKIKTFINLQHEDPDPVLTNHWLGPGTIHESELCEQLGIRYVLLTPDLMPPDNKLDDIPPAVDDFLQILDDEANYPVLLHCKAGLHRTGRLTAIYRMECQGWTKGEALREMRADGYGYYMASDADVYVIQFIENYVPRNDRKPVVMRAPLPRTKGQPLPQIGGAK
jgi:tyrosine-protein phosphatase SIW14